MATTHQRLGYATDPAALMQLQFSFAPSVTMSSGIELGVFTHIAEGKNTAAEIARASNATERGMRMLLDALVGFDLLHKRDGHYENTPLAAAHLVRSSPEYIGALMERGNVLLESWMHLTDAVRTGSPTQRVEDKENAEKFFPVLVQSLHVLHREPARRLAQALNIGSHHRGMHVVDIASGSGVWGIAVAEADPQARVTAQDYPGVLETTRRYLRRHEVEDQYDFLPGDLKQVDFGEARYDLALLGNIVHSEGERSSRDLLRRLARALKPRGRVAIIDMVPNDERTGPPFPLLFAINMLVHTGEGDVYTLSEYTAWLREAGFARVETHDIGLHSPAIVGVKA